MESRNKDESPVVTIVDSSGSSSAPVGAGEIEHQTMSWQKTWFLMLAETVSLGILGLSRAIADLGLVPGVILIVFFGLITWYGGYVIYLFAMRHPEVHSFADAFGLMLGTPGKAVAEIMQELVLIFIMAAHILSFSVMMSTLTEHSTCTVVWLAVGTVVSVALTLPRALKKQSYLSVLSCVSIVAAVLITMTGVASGHGPATSVRLSLPGGLDSLSLSALAVADMVMAFTGGIAFFGFIAEMEKPRDFPKSLALLQVSTTALYIVAAVVIYVYVGEDVKAPALASASPLIRKIAFGVACPTIVIAGVINAHIAGKNFWRALWRDLRKTPEVMHIEAVRSWSFYSWVIIISILWTVAFIIAGAIPVFSQLIAIVGAGLCVWFSLGFPALFWMSMNRGQLIVTKKKAALFLVNAIMFVLCVSICALGLYGSATSIAANPPSRKPFSCADNSV